MNKFIPLSFFILALSVLLFGSFMGILAGTQYISPTFLKEALPFSQLREIHVTSMVSWIVLCATGGVYYYFSIELGNKLHSNKLALFHLGIFFLTGLCIYASLFAGYMGGREYLTFPPLLMIPILIGWILMGINYFKTLVNQYKSWPVYLWMWGTGIAFMIFHLAESNLWIFDFIREDYIRDLSVQWKSNGSFTGSWNLLVYGTAIFLMTKIKGDPNIARSKTAFFFYFLGLANLMLGWAHHIYPVPGATWIRIVAYSISMSEWILLAYMLTQWISSLKQEDKQSNSWSFRMLVITDIWIFINVLIAVLISIPAINHYTHGSHITVAHSMGTTIGINTPILLASVAYFVSRITKPELGVVSKKSIYIGVILFNLSLIVFLSSLITAGLIKGMMLHSEEVLVHSELMEKITPYLYVFLISGISLFIGLTLIATPFLIILIKSIITSNSHSYNKDPSLN